jgi:hypothetical protein
MVVGAVPEALKPILMVVSVRAAMAAGRMKPGGGIKGR